MPPCEPSALWETEGMQSVKLDTPGGIDARFGWDPNIPAEERRRILARELVAQRLDLDPAQVHITGEKPKVHGYHPRLLIEAPGVDDPLTVVTASHRAATVVGIADPDITIGLDVRDHAPDEEAIVEMQRGSHLLKATDVGGLLTERDTNVLLQHWTRVQAVIEADGRDGRVRPDHVRLDWGRRRGWVSDRKAEYALIDVSRNGWIVTLAYTRAV